jgi:histidine triad (HIT) family protein
VTDCLFCKIASGAIPSEVVLDRGGIVAFRDVNPQAPVHALIIPKEHVTDVASIGDEHGSLLVEMIGAANEIAAAEGIAESGYRLVLNRGPDAGQTVFHLHLHVLGGRAMGWPPG